LQDDPATPPGGKAPGIEPIPGYRLLEPLGKGGFGEVWKCVAPGGLHKAIKFVGDEQSIEGTSAAAKQELSSLELVKTIRHPFMLSMERVDVARGELIIVMELADCSLRDVFAEYRAAGKPGIPREELLGYLREAAEVLDFMNRQHGLQHLDVKPHNLFLISQHIKVADFGLVSSMAERKKDSGPLLLSGVSPLYSAPEIFNGQFSDNSDQYSLAVTYQELLTGTFPIQGKNPRQLMLHHLTGAPVVETLPEADRAIVARALAKDPEHRFASCQDFVKSLIAGEMVSPPLSAPPSSSSTEAVVELPDPAPSTLEINPWTHAPEDAVPGYRLRACLNTHPLGDHWLVRAPEGRDRCIQLLNTPPHVGAAVVEKLKALRHRALPPADILRTPSGRVYLVYDPFEQTLRDRCDECRTHGLMGIPREELLGYLRDCAAALDELLACSRLPHLCLQPRHVLLGSEGVQFLHFGLAALTWQSAGKPAGPLNARYAAPELFQSGGTLTADQYSLAMIYIEMLTGVLPRPARGSGAVRVGRSSGPGGRAAPPKLDLDWLPAFDRPALTRALHTDPSQRFASCTELVQALERAPHRDADVERPTALASVLPVARLLGTSVPGTPLPSVDALTSNWVLAATGAAKLWTHNDGKILLYPDHTLEHRFPVRMIPGALQLKLHDFPKQWSAQVIRRAECEFVCRIATEQTFWQRMKGGVSGLEVRVQVQPLDGRLPQIVEATVHVKPYGAGNQRLVKELANAGSMLIDSVRSFLKPEQDQRIGERWPCALPLQMFPVADDGSPLPQQDAVARNLALTAIGFQVAQAPTTDYAYLTPANVPGLSDFALLVKLCRNRAREGGGFDVGGVFVMPTKPADGQASSPQ
jgi:serine/threonine protein kinase